MRAAVVLGLVALSVAGCHRPDVEVVTPARATPTMAVVTSTVTATATTSTTPTPLMSTSTTTTSTSTSTTTTSTSTTTTTTVPGPGDSLFPDHRIVALYGNDSASVLGVLGEQPPDEAAARLRTLIAGWASSDRPVVGAFELIATIATVAPGDAGLHRSRSRPEHVQRYLDAANANGFQLILDIQPGRSDFLTEVRHYEPFLREPNVHVALDPEWRVRSDQRPGGGRVGQVDAAEVNEVAEYLATLVAEEGLPDKLLVVHQFQSRMVTNRDRLVEPDGITLTIHMDGFGTREQKLATYSVVHADEPWNNGFKLFYDEDVDMFAPDDVLGLHPVPDLITYQ